MNMKWVSRKYTQRFFVIYLRKGQLVFLRKISSLMRHTNTNSAKHTPQPPNSRPSGISASPPTCTRNKLKSRRTEKTKHDKRRRAAPHWAARRSRLEGASNGDWITCDQFMCVRFTVWVKLSEHWATGWFGVGDVSQGVPLFITSGR